MQRSWSVSGGSDEAGDMPAGPLSPPTVAVNSDVSRWASSLPDDLVRLIASLLLAGDLLDYVRFRAVCASWRSGTASPRGRGVVDPRFHPRRWMMLPEGDGLHPGHPKLHGYVRFFNLDTGALVRVHIPLFKDHCALDSIDGLLLLQRDHDTAIRVLHPFTGDIVDLPPLSTILPQSHLCDLTRVWPMKMRLQILRKLCAAATFVDGVVTVMLAFVPFCNVAVATPQDRQWTVSTITWSCSACYRVWSSQGKIYVASETCELPSVDHILQIDTPLPGEPVQPPKLIATSEGVGRYVALSLVECDSEILVIFYSSSLAKMLLVYKLADLVVGRYIPVTSIGGKVIFINHRSITASAKASPILKGDTIIYIHHIQNERCISEYDLSNDTRLPAMDHCSLHGIEPGPCSLIHHMITCCSRRHWNKGLLIGRKQWPYYLRWPSTAGGDRRSLRHGA